MATSRTSPRPTTRSGRMVNLYSGSCYASIRVHSGRGGAAAVPHATRCGSVLAPQDPARHHSAVPGCFRRIKAHAYGEHRGPSHRPGRTVISTCPVIPKAASSSSTCSTTRQRAAPSRRPPRRIADDLFLPITPVPRPPPIRAPTPTGSILPNASPTLEGVLLHEVLDQPRVELRQRRQRQHLGTFGQPRAAGATRAE